MPLTPEQHTLRGRMGAYKKWAQNDPVEGTAAARAAMDAKFYEGIPDDLPEAERERRAASARKAYFTRLAFLSAKARSKKAST